MSEEEKKLQIDEILDKLSRRKSTTLLQCMRECQLKKVEHPFITREEYIDKLLNYIKDLQQKVEQLEKERDRLNNIINELEKELREGSFDVYFCSTNTQKTFKSNEIIIKSLILDKLKKLKEEKNA